MAMLTTETRGAVTRVIMNRPEVRNAFNDALVEELQAVFTDPPSRILELRGAGPVFSAGADLEWMKRSAELDETVNRDEARRLGHVFRTLDECNAVVVAAVQGAALGGGMGLVSCCDIVIAESKAIFGFTEARLGIAPAVISPFAIRKIGVSQARRYFTTGERFSADEAHRIGLVHEVVPAEEFGTHVEKILAALAAGGPEAVLASKRLVRDVATMDGEKIHDHTSQVIAALRCSEEGQEGLSAFLEKRKPDWVIS
ncbi:MAG: enoyl-CoA hydratase-related protein [Myxococcota bacterium]